MTPRFLKPLSSLIVLLLLTGCHYRHGGPYPAPGNVYSIQLWVHGPFLDALTKTGMNAFMLREEEDKHKEHKHKGVFSDPGSDELDPEDGPCHVTYLFELKGVESSPGRPSIDAAFDSITFSVGPDWKLNPDNGNPFIQLNLPTPSRIRFLGSLMPALFNSGVRAKVPLTQALVFTAADPAKVRLTATRVKTCGTKEDREQLADQPKLSCGDLKKKYQGYWKMPEPEPDEPEYSDRGPLKRELEKCSDNTYVYFLGAGLSSKELAKGPKGPQQHQMMVDHGKDFFNNRILGAIFGKGTEAYENAYKHRGISKIGKEAEAQATGGYGQSGRFVQIDLRYPIRNPLLLPVVSIENCKSPGAIVQP